MSSVDLSPSFGADGEKLKLRALGGSSRSRARADTVTAWQVEMEARAKDLFDEYDTDGNGFLSREEFARITPPFTDELRGNFDNWDKYGPDGKLGGDGLISRKEFEDPPTNPEEQFAALDENGDGVLSSKDGEISAEDEYAWDTYPYEGEISLEEYKKRFEEKAERDIGAVSDVKVAVDSSTMEIVVTWSEPTLEYMPEDIVYHIERFAPETYEQRMSAYRRATADWLPLKRAWDNNFEKWLDETDADGVKNRNKFPQNQWKTQFGTPEPEQPVEPSEWEPVTGPGSLLMAPSTGTSRSRPRLPIPMPCGWPLRKTHGVDRRRMTQCRVSRNSSSIRTDRSRKVTRPTCATGWR